MRRPRRASSCPWPSLACGSGAARRLPNPPSLQLPPPPSFHRVSSSATATPPAAQRRKPSLTSPLSDRSSRSAPAAELRPRFRSRASARRTRLKRPAPARQPVPGSPNGRPCRPRCGPRRPRTRRRRPSPKQRRSPRTAPQPMLRPATQSAAGFLERLRRGLAPGETQPAAPQPPGGWLGRIRPRSRRRTARTPRTKPPASPPAGKHARAQDQRSSPLSQPEARRVRGGTPPTISPSRVTSLPAKTRQRQSRARC